MKCPVCYSNNTRAHFRLERDAAVASSWGVPSASQTIHSCNQCSVQFTDRILSDDEEEQMYDQSYHDMMAGTLGESEKNTGAHEQSELRLALVQHFAAKGELLDVGCSTGIFLEKAQRDGFSVYGLDPSEYACKTARGRLEIDGTRILNSNVAEASILQTHTFDVVTAWDVIEHCASPRADMETMVNALKPGGVVVLRTPNTASIFFRTAWVLNKLTGGSVAFPLHSLYHADHLVFFNPRALEYLFQELGLEVVRLLPDPLLWKRFKYCELRRGPFVNLGIATLYAIGRALGGGHGIIAIGRKR